MRSYLIFLVSALIPFASSIVSENQAQLGEIPWQVSINGPSWYLCGGVILNEDFVISSASCTSWVATDELWIGGGSVELNNPLSRHRVTQRTPQPDYDESMYAPASHDLAILKVEPPFEFSRYEQPSRLPKSGAAPPNAGSITLFSGWGNTEYSAPISEVLLKAELPVMNQDQCEGNYGPQKGAFCTDYGSSNEDPCQNDAGGPLTANNGELVGILVKAYGCHQLVRLPALHADVAFHGAWIREVTGLP